MEEAVSTLQSVIKEEQQNGGPQVTCNLAENKTPAIISNKEQGMDHAIKVWKGVEIHNIAVFVK